MKKYKKEYDMRNKHKREISVDISFVNYANESKNNLN